MRQRQSLAAKRANRLRRSKTAAERAMEAALIAAGIWFKFQPHFYASDAMFISDFRLATATKKLLVELDGASHIGREDYDARRTAWLEANRNCIVVRFSNARVLTDAASVIAELLKYSPRMRQG